MIHRKKNDLLYKDATCHSIRPCDFTCKLQSILYSFQRFVNAPISSYSSCYDFSLAFCYQVLICCVVLFQCCFECCFLGLLLWPSSAQLLMFVVLLCLALCRAPFILNASLQVFAPFSSYSSFCGFLFSFFFFRSGTKFFFVVAHFEGTIVP